MQNSAEKIENRNRSFAKGVQRNEIRRAAIAGLPSRLKIVAGIFWQRAKSAVFQALGVIVCLGTFQTADAQTASAQQEYLAKISSGEAPAYILISKQDDKTIAKAGSSGEKLRQSSRPQEIIEWALTMADVTVLQKGRYEIASTIEIPRSGVAFIIGKEATLATAPDARLTIISEGHANKLPMIRNKNRDNVSIMNLGTIDAGYEKIKTGKKSTGQQIPLTFDGRNRGNCGIKGGLIFFAGSSLSLDGTCWVVDSENVHIPLFWRSSKGNTPLPMEGCEDCSLGFIALLTEEARENETVDFNSYNQRIRVDTIIGTGPTSNEILDINNSPNCTIERVIGYGTKENTTLVTVNKYGPGGRRLTQKRHIDNNSVGTVVKEKEYREKEVKAWEKTVETPGFPDNLPVMKINASLTAVYEDGSKEQVFEKSYEFNLAESID